MAEFAGIYLVPHLSYFSLVLKLDLLINTCMHLFFFILILKANGVSIFIISFNEMGSYSTTSQNNNEANRAMKCKLIEASF